MAWALNDLVFTQNVSGSGKEFTELNLAYVNGSVLSYTNAVPSFTKDPVLGVAGTSAGTIGLSGLTSGVVTVKTAAVAGTYNLVLPISSGTDGQFLISKGANNAMEYKTLALSDLGNGTALSVFGVTGNAAATRADMVASADHQIVRRSGTSVGFGSINLAQSGAVGTSILPVANGGTGTNAGNITGTGALTFTAGSTNTNVTLVPNGTGSVDVSSKRVINMAAPTAGTDGANKDYVDGVAQGLKPKASVRAISTSNITLSGAQTIDGVSVVAGNRVLVSGQTTTTQDGIYVAAAGAWARSLDLKTGDSAASIYLWVEEGTSNADTGWVCTNNVGADVVGTHDLVFVQFSGAGSINAGNGLTKTGNTIDIVSAAGTAGTVGTVTLTADSIGVSLGATSTTAAPGNHNHSGVYVPVGGDAKVKSHEAPTTKIGTGYTENGGIAATGWIAKDDNFFYICITGGAAGAQVWNRVATAKNWTN